LECQPGIRGRIDSLKKTPKGAIGFLKLWQQRVLEGVLGERALFLDVPDDEQVFLIFMRIEKI
jgi:hypothetical protein